MAGGHIIGVLLIVFLVSTLTYGAIGFLDEARAELDDLGPADAVVQNDFLVESGDRNIEIVIRDSQVGDAQQPQILLLVERLLCRDVCKQLEVVASVPHNQKFVVVAPS